MGTLVGKFAYKKIEREPALSSLLGTKAPMVSTIFCFFPMLRTQPLCPFNSFHTIKFFSNTYFTFFISSNFILSFPPSLALLRALPPARISHQNPPARFSVSPHRPRAHATPITTRGPPIGRRLRRPAIAASMHCGASAVCHGGYRSIQTCPCQKCVGRERALTTS